MISDKERLLIQKAKAFGIDLDEINAQAACNADEFLKSANLKVFREMTGGKANRHLYVALSSGHKHALCGHEVNENVVGAQTLAVWPGDCSKCAAQAKEIFARKK